MLIVTGGIACGKSYFKKYVEMKYKKSIIDADDWYKLVKSSNTFRNKFHKLFGDSYIDEVAFIHNKWINYEYFVHHRFIVDFLSNLSYDIVIIPEFFKFRSLYNKLDYDVLTIKRSVSIDDVFERDYNRNANLSRLIFNNQTSLKEALSMTDYSITNTGNPQTFELLIDIFMDMYYYD